ncbi:NACHT domain-containing protein [Streptomyces sp. NBC_00203]|uniref:NACHT domain-containing protein n=1 Tax=Streptomyces sp. NBC_00203 TaxID=2975680 RepID=UPI00324C4779
MSGVDPRSGVRRAGIVYLALLGVGTVGACLVAPHLDDPASVFAALLPTGAGAYLAWSAYRADRIEAAAVEGPGAVADRLATAVRHQWEAEARVRRLEDPYPLPVAWRTAGTGLVEERDPDPSTGAPASYGLAGRGGEIDAVFTERVPTRRLLVLGDPGSGKTLLLVRLVLGLIGRRQEGEPVPVLFPLASWDPAAQDLRGWMERKLVQDHAELGAPAPERYGCVTRAGMLLDQRLVLPVLDGFDELPAAVGAMALHGISEALPYGCGLVLSSRPAEYRAALRPRTGVPARLSGMAGIHLEPLGGEDVARYLLRDAGGSGTPAAGRWDPVVEVLGADAPAARALTSPLMVSLARSVYNPRPGEGHAALPDPGELLRCPTRAAVEHHLFEAFVGAAYRPHARRPCRWTAEQARTALRYLAVHMERGFDGAAEVAWWKLHGTVPGVLPRALAGVLLGALAWLAEGTVLEVVHHFTHDPDYDPSWPWRGGLGVLAGGLCGGLVGGVAAGLVVSVLGAAAAPSAELTDVLLQRLADSGAVTLMAVICCGFAVGSRPVFRRPSGWDRRVLLTGVVTAGLWMAAFHNACGTLSTVLYTLLACTMGLDGMPADPACPVARVRWSIDRRVIAQGVLAGTLVASVYFMEGVLTEVLGGEPGRFYVAPAEPLEAAWESWRQGALFAVACMLVQGLRTVPVDLAGSVDGRALLRNDRRTMGTCVLAAVVLGAAVFGAQEWCMLTFVAPRLWHPTITDDYVWCYAIGMMPALLMGLAAGLRQTAWGRYAVARWYLALRAKLPRDLMAFLADAHEHRGVLRRVGAVYQFRHIELQHHLADPERQFTGSTAATVPRSRCAPSPTTGPPPRHGRAGR